MLGLVHHLTLATLAAGFQNQVAPSMLTAVDFGFSLDRTISVCSPLLFFLCN
jgi:hypothetical protein